MKCTMMMRGSLTTYVDCESVVVLYYRVGIRSDVRHFGMTVKEPIIIISFFIFSSLEFYIMREIIIVHDIILRLSFTRYLI